MVRWDDDTTSDDTTKRKESKEVQKIFLVTSPGMIGLYAISGCLMANQDGSFDLVAETIRQADLLSNKKCDGHRDYVDRFCRVTEAIHR